MKPLPPLTSLSPRGNLLCIFSGVHSLDNRTHIRKNDSHRRHFVAPAGTAAAGGGTGPRGRGLPGLQGALPKIYHDFHQIFKKFLLGKWSRTIVCCNFWDYVDILFLLGEGRGRVQIQNLVIVFDGVPKTVTADLSSSTLSVVARNMLYVVPALFFIIVLDFAIFGAFAKGTHQ